MKPGGVVIVLAGVVLGCQVFGGQMLERLNIVTGDGAPTATTKPAVAVGPAGAANPVLTA